MPKHVDFTLPEETPPPTTAQPSQVVGESSKRADGSSKTADGPSKTADGPSKTADVTLKIADGPSKTADVTLKTADVTSVKKGDDGDNVTFNKNSGGWVGPVVTSGVVSKWKMMKDMKSQQAVQVEKDRTKAMLKRSNATLDLFGDAERHLRGGTADHKSDSSDEEDLTKKQLSKAEMLELVRNEVKIVNPFEEHKSMKMHIAWRMPTLIDASRKMLDWEKPVSTAKNQLITSPDQKLIRTEKVLSKKEDQILFLQKKLLKIHREYADLNSELERHVEQSAQLSDNRSRLSMQRIRQLMKENASLRGKLNELYREQRKGDDDDTGSYDTINRSHGASKSRGANRSSDSFKRPHGAITKSHGGRKDGCQVSNKHV